jgi:hypothetical protein
MFKIRLLRLLVDKFQTVHGRLPVKVQIESLLWFKGAYYDRSLVSLKAYRRLTGGSFTGLEKGLLLSLCMVRF